MGLLPFSRQGITKRPVFRTVEEPQAAHAGWNGDDVPALRNASWIVLGLLALPILFMLPLFTNLGALLTGSFWGRLLYAIVVSAAAAAAALTLALPSGWALARNGFGENHTARRVFRALVLLPLVVPPTVIGHYVALITNFLANYLGFSGLVLDTFHTLLLILALAYLAFPLAALTIEGAWRQADGRLERDALAIGWSLERIMYRLIKPRIDVFVLPAWLLAFARAMAELAAVTFTKSYDPVSLFLMILVIVCVFMVRDQVLGLSAQVNFRLGGPDLASVDAAKETTAPGEPFDVNASHEAITSQMEQDYRRNTPRFGDTSELANTPEPKSEPLSFSGPGATWQPDSKVEDAEAERHLAKEWLAQQEHQAVGTSGGNRGGVASGNSRGDGPRGSRDGVSGDARGGRGALSGRGGRSTVPGERTDPHTITVDQPHTSTSPPESHWYEPPSERPKPMTMEELTEYGAKPAKSPFLRIRKPKEPEQET